LHRHANRDTICQSSKIPRGDALTISQSKIPPGAPHHLCSPSRVYNSVPARGETGFAPGKQELRGGLAGPGTWRDGPSTSWRAPSHGLSATGATGPARSRRSRRTDQSPSRRAPSSSCLSTHGDQSRTVLPRKREI
jgi:hypothetical protein